MSQLHRSPDKKDVVAPDHSQSDDLSNWPDYREHSLLEGAVIEVKNYVQVSREMALFSALGAISAACQGLVDVAYPNGEIVPTSLMLLTLAESGERKTAVNKWFCKPLMEAQKEQQEHNQKVLSEHHAALQIWKTKHRSLNNKLGRRAAKGEPTKELESAICELHKVQPTKPPINKLLYENTTPSALTVSLYENLPLGYLLSDEAGALLKGEAMRDLYLLSNLWSGGDTIVDRRTGPSFTLSDARLSVMMMVQPEIFQQFIDKRGTEAHESGFLARFLAVKPESLIGRRKTLSSQLPMEEISKFRRRLKERLDAAIEKTTKGNERVTLKFSKSAQESWAEMNTQIENEMGEHQLYFHCTGHASKLMDNVSRVAALLHTFEKEDYEKQKISKDDLEFAYRLCRRASQDYLDYVAGEPEIVTLTNILVRNIRKHGQDLGDDCLGFDRATIQQKGTPGRIRLPEKLDMALTMLTRLGHLEYRHDYVKNKYRFKESILLKYREPELKNGEQYHIKELPRFTTQHYKADRTNALQDEGYVRNQVDQS